MLQLFGYPETLQRKCRLSPRKALHAGRCQNLAGKCLWKLHPVNKHGSKHEESVGITTCSVGAAALVSRKGGEVGLRRIVRSSCSEGAGAVESGATTAFYHLRGLRQRWRIKYVSVS